MINENNYKIVLIPYLTICCSLYHLIYWGFFDLNGLELISLSNLFLWAVKPVLLPLLIFLPALIRWDFKKLGDSERDSSHFWSSKQYMFDALYYAIFWAVFGGLSDYIGSKLFPSKEFSFLVAFLPMLITMILYFLINVNFFIDAEFKSKVNKNLWFFLLILFPVSSIFQGFYDAFINQSNKHYKYALKKDLLGKLPEISEDTLKLVGLTEKLVIFTTLKNDKIFFLKDDGLILYSKK